MRNIDKYFNFTFLKVKMISILIPIFNGIKFIEESVNSVLNQTYDNWELIIGINGHPKDSEVYEIAKKYEKQSIKIRVFDLYEIKGKSETLNVMLTYCTYDYVAILDVDDIWEKNKLEIQSKYLHEYDVIGTQCVYFGDLNNIIPKIPLGDISEFNFSLVNPVINSSSIIRKELCFWDGKLNLEDYDLWIRLRKQNKKFFNCQEVVVKHRIHSDSAFNSKGNGNNVKDLLLQHEM
jgi:glycosyltransferase involved in cell wall biosynthesis